jgi:hypothetical protein
MGQSQVTAYSRRTYGVPAPPPRHLPAAPYNVQHAVPARQLAPTCRHGMASTMTVREALAAVTMPSILPGTRPRIGHSVRPPALATLVRTRAARGARGDGRSHTTMAVVSSDSPTTSRLSPAAGTLGAGVLGSTHPPLGRTCRAEARTASTSRARRARLSAAPNALAASNRARRSRCVATRGARCFVTRGARCFVTRGARCVATRGADSSTIRRLSRTADPPEPQHANDG